MKIRSRVKNTFALVVLAGAAIGVQATTFSLGALTTGAPKSFNAFHAGAGLTTFTDDFTFTLASAGITGASLIDFSIPGVTGAQFTSAQLFSGVVGSGSVLATASGTASSLSFSNVSTPAGSYFLHVVGNVTPSVSLGAAYNGAISVTAVPEPESYAMLLAGLGVMGAIAMRRKSKKD